MARVPDDGLNDVLFPGEVPKFQFKIRGGRRGVYEVSVYKNQIEIKKLSTGNKKVGTYDIEDFITFLINDEIVRRPVITLNLGADRNIGPSVLKKIKEILEERITDRYNVVDFVRIHFPEEWKAINKDPIKWVLEKSKRLFVGGDRYKIAVLHSLVSSRIKKRKMRANLLIVGETGTGKSSLVNSVMSLLPEANWIHHVAKLTPEVLAYLNNKNIDGHILWVEEMDHLEYFRNLKKMLTEKVFTTWSTMKDKDGRLVKQEVRIEGIPVFISTTTELKRWESETKQILSRMLVLYFRQDYDKGVDYTIDNEEEDYPLSWKLIFYAWLWTRQTAALKEGVKRAISEDVRKIARKAKGVIFRMAHLYKQLTIAHAMIYGKEEATFEDYQFVKEHFAPDLYLNSFLLNRRDVLLMKAIKELGGARAADLAMSIDEERSEVAKMLWILTEKRLVNYDIEGDHKIYKLTPFGEKLLELLGPEIEKEEVDEEADEEEEVEGEADEEEVDEEEVDEKAEVEEVDQADEEKEEADVFWRRQIYESFGFDEFTPEEFARAISVENADELLRQLGEAGVVEEEGGKWRLRRIREE